MLPAILSLQGYKLTDDEKRLFKKYNPVGFNFFARNIENKKQLKTLVKEIKELLERNDIIFAIDQEGGRVRRLAEPEFRTYLPQYALTKAELAKEHAYLISSDLKELGLNMNYAPVLDIVEENSTPAIKSRCFSSDEKTIAKLGKTMVEEYVKNGISPCIKHMPGHGKAVVDPHLYLPILNYPLTELEKDFYPFIKNNTSPAGMTAHIIIPEIDDKFPITQSKKAIDKLIRGHIGFEGLLISDAIDMKALKGSIGEKAKASVDAGCDVVCYAFGKYEELLEICENAPKINEKTLDRLEKINNIITTIPRFDNLDVVAKRYKNAANKVELYSDNYDATETLNKMMKS